MNENRPTEDQITEALAAATALARKHPHHPDYPSLGTDGPTAPRTRIMDGEAITTTYGTLFRDAAADHHARYQTVLEQAQARRKARADALAEQHPLHAYTGECPTCWNDYRTTQGW